MDSTPVYSPKSIRWLDRSAEILDNKFRIPGTNIRFGVDALLGLFPYVGDVLTFIVSGFLIIIMARYGISGKLVLKMLGNIWIDGMFGTVPLLGDVFDLRYRANLKNVRLVKEYIAEGKHGGSAWGLIFLILLILFLMLALSVFVLWKLTTLAYGQLFNALFNF
jgi:hypothetical protein